jgi:hypothetical protein
MESQAMPSHPAQLKVRIEPEMRERLERSAAERGVSLNRELGDRLRQSLEADRAPGRKNRAAQAILRIAEETMNAAGESALFSQTLSWEVARQKNWVTDPYAYGAAMEAAIEVLKEFTPAGEPVAPKNDFDPRFWAEFVLKQAASGAGNVPEADPLARELHAGLSDLAERISAFAKIDPSENARKRARKPRS